MLYRILYHLPEEFMEFAGAIGLLLLVTITMVVLRAYWWRLSPRTERLLFLSASVVFALRFFFLVSFWGTIWATFNALLCWLAVIGYEMFLVRFSLMRPRWLTCICAFILLLPLFASTLLFPLTGIFYSRPPDIQSLGQSYELQRDPWDEKVNGRAGYDFGIYYRPQWLPFMRHIVQRSSLSVEQCQTDAVVVTIDPPKHLVHFHCPGHPGQSDVDHTLPLQ